MNPPSPIAIPPLPEPLGGPLPIFGFVITWTQVLWILAAIALIAWWIRRRRNKRAAVTATAQAPEKPLPPPESDVAKAIRALEERWLALKQYREGCHDLDREVRRRIEYAIGREVEALTAAEIEALFEDKAWVGLARRLRDAGYGRRDPSRDDFRDLCRAAVTTLEGKRTFALRRANPKGSETGDGEDRS